MGNIIRLGLILMIFCLVSALSLSYVNDVTSPIISENSAKREAAAKQALFIENALDLTKFPDREYIAKDPKNNLREVIKIKKSEIYEVLIDTDFFGFTKAEAKVEIDEIVDLMNTDQLVDISKSPEKHRKIYEYILKAFTSSIEIKRQRVVLDVYGVNIPLQDNNTSFFRDSEIFFTELKDGNLALEKVDQDYFEKLSSDRKIIFKDSTSVDIDNRKNSFRIIEYDKVVIGDFSPGYVFKVSPTGYSSNLETLVAVNQKGKIVGLKVVSQQETPGLGAKAQESWFQDQFKGVSLENLYLSKKSNFGKIDAITAATITSEAVTSGVRKGLEDFLKVIGGEK